MYIHPVQFTIALLLLLALAIGRLGYLHRREKRRGVVDDGGADIRQVKQRLHVLERITVDKENTLARQIEELRDR